MDLTRQSSGNHDDDKQASLRRLAAQLKRSWPRCKLLAPAVAGALLLTPFVLEHRLRDWMSPTPFFTYILFFLFFFPTPSPVGSYLERSIITLAFVAAGTGISFLAVCGCIWIDGENAPTKVSKRSRAIGVCVLMFFCFTTGTLSSYAPRLKNACRAVVFSTLWELTTQYNVISARIFLDHFYPALTAMIVGIFCNFVVFPRTARAISINQLCELFDGTARLTILAVDGFFEQHAESARKGKATQSKSFSQLKKEVQSLQARLCFNLDAAQNEIAFARVPVGHLQLFLPMLRDIRGWFNCRIACLQDASVVKESSQRSEQPTDCATDHTTPQPAFDFEGPIRAFSHDITRSLFCLRRCIAKCTDSEASAEKRLPAGVADEKADQSEHSSDPELDINQQRAELRASIRSFKTALSDAIKRPRSEMTLDAQRQHEGDQDGTTTSDLGTPFSQPSTPTEQSTPLAHLFRNDSYQTSFLMISLLEVALLVDSCLNAASGMAKIWAATPRRRLHMPVADWRYWLGRTSLGGGDNIGLADERVDALLHEDDEPLPADMETQLDEVDFFDEGSQDLLTLSPTLERTDSRVSDGVASLRHAIRRSMRALRKMFATRRALHCRVALSNIVTTLRHSRHIKFGFKLTAGIVLLTLPAWLPPSDSKRWWYDKRGQWMAISYLFCLETSTGASIRTSLFRILGTIFGSLLGLLISEVSRRNPYALAFLLSLASIPPSYLMLFTRFQGVGVVMGLTLPIVALIPQEDAGQSVAYVAWNRGYMILLGIIAALLVNLFVWPIHARLELVRRISLITSKLQSLYLSLSRQMLLGGLTSSHKSNAAFEELEGNIEFRIGQARGLVDIMKIEVSLKPKRTRVLSELLDQLERIHELLLGLRRCREHGLRSVRQHAVVNVLELRQSFIAAVLLVLWTTGQALQTKAPLPQCLPSPRLALEELTEAVAEQLRDMVEEGVQGPSRMRGRRGAPDAFHALDSLNQKSILINVRRRHRKGLHSIQSYSPTNGSRSGAASPARHSYHRTHHTTAHSETETPGTTAVKRSLDYATFFVLAEHALLEEIVSSLERLSELCRSIVGEASFLTTEFVPHTSGHGVDGDSRTLGGVATPVAAGRSEAEDAMRTGGGRSLSVPDTIRGRDGSPMSRPLHSSRLRPSADAE
ncbi:putative membrane protein [Pseudozyma hubeiensis]|nr:putative membrane protein [Pseudozyma hubeiensis]